MDGSQAGQNTHAALHALLGETGGRGGDAMCIVHIPACPEYLGATLSRMAIISRRRSAAQTDKNAGSDC